MYVYYLIALFVIIVDQVSKWLVVKYMDLSEQITIIDNFFYITSHRNAGAAWGMLQGQMWFFYIITVIVIIGIVYYMHVYAKGNILMLLSLGLILGGAIGNFIDRVVQQEVVDFLDFMIFTYDYPIFNIADSALVVGVILIIVATFIDEKKKGKSTS